MKGNLKIHLKPRERIFINGAVLRVDRKVTVELLNDVTFLLEGHVMQEEGATTPLRQLYFVVQSMLMEPKTINVALQIYQQLHRDLLATYKDIVVLETLIDVKMLIEAGRPFEALKKIRVLYPIEDQILGLAVREPDAAVA